MTRRLPGPRAAHSLRSRARSPPRSRPPRDDDRPGDRHRLEQHRRRPRVAVLTHGKRDDAGALEATAHLVEREVDLDSDVARPTGQRAGAVGRRDGEEARLGHRPGHRQQQLEVAVGIGAHRDDVDIRRRAGRPKRVHVHAERHKLDAHVCASLPQPPPEHVGLVLAVRHDRVRRAQRPRIEPLHALRPELHEALGQPDRRVDEGGRTMLLRARSMSGIPTVSTVEKTTSARLSPPRDERTARSRRRSRLPPRGRA